MKKCSNWNDVQVFIRNLNQKEGIHRYRLPTEMEWLFVVFSGSETNYLFKKKPTTRAEAKELFGDHAWFYMNVDGPTHPVGQKRANRYGLYDLLGNVYEWVQNRDAALSGIPANALALRRDSTRCIVAIVGDTSPAIACWMPKNATEQTPGSPV